MSEHILKTVEELERKLLEQQTAVTTTKKLINQLCEMANTPPRYANVEAENKSGPSLSIRSDQFYGQPQATCVRVILEMRKALDKGPATINEIYDALQQGGFAFDTKNDENAKRGLRISVAKNTALFHKLPNGRIGLLEWYPNAKNSKPKKGPVSQNETESDEDLVGEENEGEM